VSEPNSTATLVFELFMCEENNHEEKKNRITLIRVSFSMRISFVLEILMKNRRDNHCEDLVYIQLLMKKKKTSLIHCFILTSNSTPSTAGTGTGTVSCFFVIDYSNNM
jgi:hypothetical protein